MEGIRVKGICEKENEGLEEIVSRGDLGRVEMEVEDMGGFREVVRMVGDSRQDVKI